MNEEIDWSTVEEDDLITFEDGTVVCIRGIINQDDQWVFQLSDGTDLRIKKPFVADAAP